MTKHRTVRALAAVAVTASAGLALGIAPTSAATVTHQHTNCNYHLNTTGSYSLIQTCVGVTTVDGKMTALTTSMKALFGTITLCDTSLDYLSSFLGEGPSLRVPLPGCFTVNGTGASLTTPLPADWDPNGKWATVTVLDSSGITPYTASIYFPFA